MNMKLKMVAAAAAMLVAGAASAAGVAAATGGATSTSGSVAAAGAAGTGSATSLGFNQGYAKTSISADVNTTGSATVVNVPTGLLTGQRTTTTNLAGEVGVTGVTETANMSGVKTTSSGPALAFAGAGGLSAGSSTGAGAFDTGSGGAPAGNVIGSEGSLSATGALSVQNGSNLQNVGRISYFEAGASADRTTVTVQNTFLGIPVGQPAASVAVNTATNAAAGSVNTGGFGLPPALTNSGTAIGGAINVGAGAAAAGSSAAGNVSAIDIDLAP